MVLQWWLFTITFPSSQVNQNVKPESLNSPAKTKNSFSFSVRSLSPTPLYIYNIFCLSIRQLMNIWAIVISANMKENARPRTCLRFQFFWAYIWE